MAGMEGNEPVRSSTAPSATGTGTVNVEGVALPVGATIAEFEILQVLGKGGFGIVYLARDCLLQRQVAVKEYLPTSYALRHGDMTVVVRSAEHQATFESGLRSFLEEARLLAQFDHPSLVKVHRFWEANGTAYMAMPYYEGRTLKEIFQSDPYFATESRLKGLLAPLLDAVAMLHAKRCYHRDISPDNIIVQPDGTPVLLDFGAARRIIGDMTHALTVMLKPGYAPIEQYAEEGGLAQGPWTDVYAFGAVLYRAITGDRPPAGVGRVYRDTLVPLQTKAPVGYSQHFLRGVDHALAVKPEDRPQTIGALREALGIANPGEPWRKDDSDKTVHISGASAPQSPGAVTSPGSVSPAKFPSVASPPAREARPDAPISLPPDSVRASERRQSPISLAAIVAGAAGLGVVVAAAVWYLQSGSPDVPGTPAGAPAAVAPASSPTITAQEIAPVDPRPEIEAMLRTLDCANVAYDLDADGRVVLRGRVRDESQVAGLEQRLGRLTGVKSVATELSLVPNPFCEVVGKLEALATLPGPAGLGVRVVRPTPPLRIGQQGVTLEVMGPAFPASITVDVWNVAERDPARMEVSHLLPHGGYALSDRFRPNERKLIDRISDGASGPVRIAVMPPPGQLLITAVASTVPLARRERPLEEGADAYVSALQRAAARDGGASQIAIWYGFVEVRR